MLVHGVRHVGAYVWIYVYFGRHMRRCWYKYVYMHVFMYMCVYICMVVNCHRYIYMYVYICVYLYSGLDIFAWMYWVYVFCANKVTSKVICCVWRRWLLGWGCLTWVSGKARIHSTRLTVFEPQGTVPHAQTFLGGAKFIAWNLRHDFLGGRRRGPRHFWSCRAGLDYGSAPGHTSKKALCYTRPLVGARGKLCNMVDGIWSNKFIDQKNKIRPNWILEE